MISGSEQCSSAPMAADPTDCAEPAVSADEQPTPSAMSELWNINIAALSLFARPIAALLKSHKRTGKMKNIHFQDNQFIDLESHYLFNDSIKGKGAENVKQIEAHKQIVLLGAGSGTYMKRALKQPGKSLLVVEPEAHLLALLFSHYDFSQAIAQGRLHLIITQCNNPALEVVSLQSCTLELQQYYAHWKGDFALIKSGSYRVHEHFFNAIIEAAHVWKQLGYTFKGLDSSHPLEKHEALEQEKEQEQKKEPNKQSHAPTQTTPSAAPKTQHDVVIITPRCYIFHDLALAFKKLGLKPFLVSIPDNSNNSFNTDQRFLKTLKEQSSRLIISRNRSAFETRNANHRAQLERHIDTPIAHWWWDTPNIASVIDLEDKFTRQPHLAFARDLLRVLPIGSQWLPAGAQSRFCTPDYQRADSQARPITLSFVGQSRADLLINNVSILIKSLADLIDPKYREMTQEFNALPGIVSIYTFLARLSKEITPTLEQTAKQWPKQVYYLRYILEMCTTGAFRLAAIKTLIDSGYDVQVFGDEGWVKHQIIPKSHFRGVIEAEALPSLFKQSKINLNLNFMQVSSAINPKVLDITACGGTVLSDYRPEVDYLYPDAALRPFTFETLDELPERVAQLLSFDLNDHRQQLAEFTQRDHSLLKRAEWIAQHYHLS